jgi:hypothetical protein
MAPAEIRPPLDPDALTVLAASRPAHEIFAAVAAHLAQSDPAMRLKTFSISRTPLLTLNFVLPDGLPGVPTPD